MPGGNWSPSHARVSNGKLTLSTYKVNGAWTSGGVMNYQGGHSTYGKFEVRMRMDKAPGVKYALLLWPASDRWPAGGEIDFAEDGGGNRSGTTGTVIYSTNGSTAQQMQQHVNVDLSQWHTVGVEWAPGRVTFTLDGGAWGSVSTPYVPSGAMNLGIQTEAGSCNQWMSCTDNSTPAVTNLDVDWVTVYQAK